METNKETYTCGVCGREVSEYEICEECADDYDYFEEDNEHDQFYYIEEN